MGLCAAIREILVRLKKIQSDLFKFPFSSILLRITRPLGLAHRTPPPWRHPLHTSGGWSPPPSPNARLESAWLEGAFGILLGWALKARVDEKWVQSGPSSLATQTL